MTHTPTEIAAMIERQKLRTKPHDRREHRGLELKAYKGRLIHARETVSYRDDD